MLENTPQEQISATERERMNKLLQESESAWTKSKQH